MLELRGANSAFDNGTNQTDGSEGCYRRVYLRSLGIDIKPQDLWDKFKQMVTFGIGKQNEQVMKDYLCLTNPDSPILEEEAVSKEFEGEAVVVGHIDLQQDGLIYETKMVSSLNSYHKFFIEQSPKKNNVAQLVTYLWIKEAKRGILRYTNCIWSPNITLKKAEVDLEWFGPQFKDYVIELYGKVIYMNGEPYQYTLEDLLTHKRNCVTYLKDPGLLESIGKPEYREKTCNYCELSKTCTALGRGKSSIGEFVTEAQKFNKEFVYVRI